MRRIEAFSALGVMALALVAVAAPVSAADQSYMAVQDLVPALAEPQAELDRGLPLDVLDELGGLNPDSTRFLGEDDKASYWVAQDEPSNVCLVIHTSWSTSSSCADFPRFHRSGIGMATGQSYEVPEDIIEAYLLPSDISPEQIAETGAYRDVKLSSQATKKLESDLLVVDTAASDKLSGETIERSSGESFQFTPLEYGPSSEGK
ncbi:hypothetical protein CQ010_04840 [Arthrobacter sp. MYb211]|uniref:hypothetical protein n=1 Tax=Micrococcaceae TaxID=1268 RepID=UPI000BB868D8|nr:MULTISPECIES: hypothetical protein [Micrococcaceae]PCC29557.1 hypothetical protein CIK76_06120 [Glutamicibacter sp. BW80]PRA01104.1 hypothetical protein CQ017_00940 [Arthrobacter sp. MYb224]PRA06735.1 hypothetical protein CQ019_05000 [Arthrobacter sp. MYb229]PRA13875.1 hypothetical protein CQ015_00835 [Arthrobacter sp. MYb221]PRB53636.1 hypothetical protein CQ013_05000 [Arthrobacter sp. MYb216]